MKAVVAILVDAEDHVHVLALGRGAQRADGLGRDLPVGGQEGDPLATRMGDAGLETRAHAAVRRVAHDGARAVSEHLSGALGGGVVRAVVDDHHLGVGLVGVEPREELFENGADVLFFVVGEDDDGQIAHGLSRTTFAGLPTATA